jgi:pyridoxal phosphate enzyme (YggS family)
MSPAPSKPPDSLHPNAPVVVPSPPAAGETGPPLHERYATVKDRVAAAARRAGSDPRSVVLVAVTKNAEPDQIRDLIGLGHADFAENRVQQLTQRAAIIGEWLGRQKAMPAVGRAKGATAEAPPPSTPSTPQVRWHMIGHLQRNKARKVVELCRLIHSVDSLRLAEELQLIAARRENPVEVLLQVNCSGEPSKFGCAIGAAIHLAEQIETMVQVRLRGMMTMAPISDNPDDSLPTFGRGRELFVEIRDSGVVSPAFNILSMGMSGDYEQAIAEGSNMVRVGTALFGAPRAGADEEDGGAGVGD